MLLSTPCWGQSEAPADQTVASNAITIDEIIVTARKRSERLIDVPDSVTAFSAADIERRGIDDVRDFANQTPNFTFTTTSGPDRPSISVRGIAQATGGELPVAVTVDGVQLAHSAFISQSLYGAERIEVLRGPQGSLYGRNAIGGAINIFTKQPTNEFEGSARASYGNADSVRLDGNISGSIIDDTLLFRLTSSFSRGDGQIRNTFLNTRVDHYRDFSVAGLLVIQPAANLTIDLRGTYGDNRSGSLSAEIVPHALFHDFRPGFLSRNVDTISTRKLYDVSAKIDYEFGGGYSLTSISGYSRADTLLFGDGDFSPGPFVLQDVDLEVRAFTQELRLTSPSSGRFRWLVGAFYQNRDTKNFLNVPFDDGSGRPTNVFAVQSFDVQTSKSYAFFGSASYDILTNLELTLGLRYDNDRKTSVDILVPTSAAAGTFKKLQPKVQLAYKVTPDLNVYATYGRGYRSGGFNAFRSVGVSRVFDAETADNYEVGLKGSLLDGAMTFSAAAFQIDYADQQFFFINTNPPSQNIINIDETRIRGVELEAAIRPTEQLEFLIGLGVIDPEIRANAVLPPSVGNNSPQATLYTFTGSAQYTAPVGNGNNVRAYAGYRRTGRRYWDAANTLFNRPKDFVDLRLFFEAPKWSIGAFVENLTNSQFAEVANADVFGPGVAIRIPSARRKYGLEARVKF